MVCVSSFLVAVLRVDSLGGSGWVGNVAFRYPLGKREPRDQETCEGQQPVLRTLGSA